MFRYLVRALILVVFLGLALSDATVPVSSPKLVYTTYVANTFTESGPVSAVYALAVDSSGYAYVGGSGPGSGGSGCALLTKLNQTGTAAVWSVCLPLAEVAGVALDVAGHIYVVGNTYVASTGSHISVVMKLSPDARQTIYSLQIGDASPSSIAVDAAGNAYISGPCGSTFQATPGAYMTTGGGAFEAFAAKLNVAGTIEYATYLDLWSANIAVDGKGQAWVVGAACLTSGCETSVTGYAAGIRKLDASGAHLLVSETFGGASAGEFGPAYSDSASGVAVDGTDSVWVVGGAETNAVPTTPYALEPQRPGPVGRAVGYALKLSSSGDLLYGTYIRDYDPNEDHGIISTGVDPQGQPYFGLNATPLDGSTVMALSADGKSVLASAAFVAPVRNLALDGSGGLYLSGNTNDTAFFTTLGAYEVLYPGGGNSGYASKFDLTTPAPSTQFLSLVNAAEPFIYAEAPVAPGEIVTLFGQNLPSNPTVTFDGRAAPVLYASATQINTVVPFEVTPPTTTVMLNGAGGFVLPVWPAVTGLFTLNGSGKGQLAALNEDGTLNSSANPAKVGSVVAVYMTGAGAMTPPIADGQLGPLQPPFPSPVLGVSALMNNSPGLSNGIPAPVLFAGQAPALIAGAVQVNVQVPAGVPSGNVSLTIYVGNYETQLGPVTIAVQ